MKLPLTPDLTKAGAAALRDPRISTAFVQANGLTFEVDQCGTGDKLALCLHGFPESSFSWRYQLPVLADLGYTAWAPNMRGYGKSSRPALVEDYALPHLLADVAGLIDAAGKSEVVLIAHDWGAVIAWISASSQRRRARNALWRAETSERELRSLTNKLQDRERELQDAKGQSTAASTSLPATTSGR